MLFVSACWWCMFSCERIVSTHPFFPVSIFNYIYALLNSNHNDFPGFFDGRSLHMWHSDRFQPIYFFRFFLSINPCKFSLVAFFRHHKNKNSDLIAVLKWNKLFFFWKKWLLGDFWWIFTKNLFPHFFHVPWVFGGILLKKNRLFDQRNHFSTKYSVFYRKKTKRL